MKIFSADLHFATQHDLKTIFERLGHQLFDCCLSGHHWILNKPRWSHQVLNARNWETTIRNADSFYNVFKNDLDQFDAFICSYPPSFALLYDKWNKPIILHIPIRYEHPFNQDPEWWNRFNEYLRRKHSEGLLIPLANSKYDKEYFEYFTGIPCQHIPSLCDYTGNDWHQTQDQSKYLMFTRRKIDPRVSPFVATKEEGLGNRYPWSKLLTFKGIVNEPYQHSLMSIFEARSSSIPQFMPTKRYAQEIYFSEGCIIAESSWNACFGHPPGSRIKPFDPNTNIPDPNQYLDKESIKYWLDFADYYDTIWMPEIVYYDSIEDLVNKLQTTNLEEVSTKMRNHNIWRKDNIMKSWQKILTPT